MRRLVRDGCGRSFRFGRRMRVLGPGRPAGRPLQRLVFLLLLLLEFALALLIRVVRFRHEILSMMVSTIPECAALTSVSGSMRVARGSIHPDKCGDRRARPPFRGA